MKTLRFIERILAGELRCCQRRMDPTHGTEARVLGDFSAIIKWYDETNRLRLVTHCYVSAAGRIGGTYGILDPKFVHDHETGIDYVLLNAMARDAPSP